MSRKPMRNLVSHRQYIARLRPIINQINREVAGDVQLEDNQAQINNYQNNIDYQNVEDQDLPIENQVPLQPNDDEPPEIFPDFEEFYEWAQQNNEADNGLIDELLPNRYPGFNNGHQNQYLQNENNIFEIPIRRNDNSDDEDEERPEQIHDDDNNPLYLGAEITKRESMLVILAMCLKHHLSMTCIDDLIRVIELHCLSRGLIKNNKENVKKHFYCPSCASQLNNENEICYMCPQTESTFFLELPIIDHLKEMYKSENFFNSLQERFNRPNINNNITDIFDGELYKTWTENGFLSNPNNISFTWYTDGVPVFKSSKISIWPIYLTISELPFEERKKIFNTLLLGLWYGDKKPHFNSFFYAFRPVFESLLLNGIKVVCPGENEITVRAALLMGVCDLPAKIDSLNFVNFNSKYGCPVCFFEGRVMQIGPRSYLQVYPYSNTFQLRSSRICEDLARQATPDNPQFGIKGPTSLAKLMPDFMSGMCIDRMHAVDGGVIKKILNLVFNISYRNEPFSLYTHKDTINNRLQLIKPPKFIHRMPRTTDDLIHWKASELKMAVFEGIMRADYLNHYLLLMVSMYFLSADEISELMITTAEDFLYRFVREFQQLYGEKFSSINIHLLLHLPKCVRLHGPLWAHHCYEYESFNGEILLHIHGTRHIGSQVSSGHGHLIRMITDVEQIPNESYVRMYIALEHKILQEIPDIIISAMNNSGIVRNGEYTRAMKTSTSVVKYLDAGTEQVGRILCFIKYLHCQCLRNNCTCNFKYYAIIQKLIRTNSHIIDGDNFQIDSSNIFYKCSETNIYQAIDVNNLLTPCIFINMNNQSHIIYPLNTKELE
ncbi:Protein of unknown function [Cotesia congregata]|uniref:Transposase domain-containing protein n=1 Tax=Cotesia congregata TaxID=51543 RepID=A0A8J2MKV0_COTCN|nr:Protein of unknown function [Cotesia congregata]